MAQKPTIICVDDERSILEALKEQLNRYLHREYTIECAESGEKALIIFRELAEDNLEVPVVISDHIMPGMKGDELLRKIFQLNPRVRKILLTGQADADAVGRAVNSANLYRYISKPWEHDDLALTIQEAIRSYYQDKTLEQQNDQLKKVNQDLALLNNKLEQKIEIFNKFVPREFLNILKIDFQRKTGNLKEFDEYIELSQCAARELTVMFADIRSFTSICEGMTSSQAFEFINGYLFEISPVITRFNGFIDKFIGDAIMAIFKDATDAVGAAIAMQQQMEQFNKRLNERGQDPINIGIGINTDIVMLGTLGESNRLQTTVIGDAVNLAQRTEKITKDFNTKVVITENSIVKLNPEQSFLFRFLDYSQVKGKTLQTNFYELLNVFDLDIQKKKFAINDLYQKGVMAFYRDEITDAEETFKECLTIYPEDTASLIYLSRIRERQANVEKVNAQLALSLVQHAVNPDLQRYLKFWGTRKSYPVSGSKYSLVGCNTSTLEFRNQRDLIILDAGSGICLLGDQIMREEIHTIHIFWSNFQWEHLLGFPYFSPLFDEKYDIHIYAMATKEEMELRLSTLIEPRYLPGGKTAASLTLHQLQSGQPVKIGKTTVYPSKSYKFEFGACYRIDTGTHIFGYVLDNNFNIECDPYNQIEFFKNCELLICDTPPLSSGCFLENAVEDPSLNNFIQFIQEIKPLELIITDHYPNETDEILQNKLKFIEKEITKHGFFCNLKLSLDGMFKDF